MDFAGIRKSLHLPNQEPLTQKEMAILLGTSVGSVRNWEQAARTSPSGTTITLYRILEKKDKGVLNAFISIAGTKQYEDMEDFQAYRSLITKVIKNKLERALLDMMPIASNSQFTPEQMGFKVTKIKR